MTGYLLAYGTMDLPHDLIPTVEHEIVSHGAMVQEMAREGSGKVVIPSDDEALSPIRDGWAVFSTVPERLLRQIRRLR